MRFVHVGSVVLGLGPFPNQRGSGSETYSLLLGMTLMLGAMVVWLAISEDIDRGICFDLPNEGEKVDTLDVVERRNVMIACGSAMSDY